MAVLEDIFRTVRTSGEPSAGFLSPSDGEGTVENAKPSLRIERHYERH